MTDWKTSGPAFPDAAFDTHPHRLVREALAHSGELTRILIGKGEQQIPI